MKIKTFISMVIIFLSMNGIKGASLEDYKSSAKNAVCIVFGKEEGKTYILLAHDKRGFWTPMGGKREPYHTSILDTAAEELYEETAAFPLFEPKLIKEILKKMPLENVFNYHNHTDLFLLDIGDKIKECRNISQNFKERIAGKKGAFHEMDKWEIFLVEDLFDALEKHSNITKEDVFIDKIGRMKSYVFNSLWKFYKYGSLKKLMAFSGQFKALEAKNEEKLMIETHSPRKKFRGKEVSPSEIKKPDSEEEKVKNVSEDYKPTEPVREAWYGTFFDNLFEFFYKLIFWFKLRGSDILKVFFSSF